MREKKKIYYARTYRRIRMNLRKSFLYLFLLVVPGLVGFIMNIGRITSLLATLTVEVLGRLFPGTAMQIGQDTYSVFGRISYVEMPTVYPDHTLVCINLVLTLGIILVLATGKRKGKPFAIFSMLSLLIHLINCIYFLFASDHFPYTFSDYSNLYLKQEIGIWIMFILLSGLVTCFLGDIGWRYKILAFFGINLYALLFGMVRYILFAYLLRRFSILYMALMFFVVGPLFDFSYFVTIYGVFVNKMIKLYESGKGREEWEWA